MTARLDRLPPAPDRAYDDDYRARDGRYAGQLHEVRWGYYRGWLHGQVRRALVRKRWFQVVVRGDRLALICRIQDDGTVGHARCLVLDLESGAVLDELLGAGAPLRTMVTGFMAGEGTDAFLRAGGADVALSRPAGGSAWRLAVDWCDLRLDLSLDTASAPGTVLTVGAARPPWDHRPGLTQRSPLLAVEGRATLGGRSLDLGGAVGEVVYANAFLAPGTRAEIVSAAGRLPDGRRVALALSDGDLHGSCPEAALLLDDGAWALPVARSIREGGAWRWSDASGDLDLRFVAEARHTARHEGGPLRTAQELEWQLGRLEGNLPLPDGRSATVDLAATCEAHRWG